MLEYGFKDDKSEKSIAPLKLNSKQRASLRIQSCNIHQEMKPQYIIDKVKDFLAPVRWFTVGVLFSLLIGLNSLEESKNPKKKIESLSLKLNQVQRKLFVTQQKKIEFQKLISKINQRELSLLPKALLKHYQSQSLVMKDLDIHQFLVNCPLTPPLNGYFTSSYGKRKLKQQKYLRRHKGLDIASKAGALVVSAAPGRIVEVKSKKSSDFGLWVKVDHGMGILTLYAHMNRIMVKKGDRVVVGQALGTVGKTGRATGPHLHYEIHISGKAVNPKEFVTYQTRRAKKLQITNFHVDVAEN